MKDYRLLSSVPGNRSLVRNAEVVRLIEWGRQINLFLLYARQRKEKEEKEITRETSERNKDNSSYNIIH